MRRLSNDEGFTLVELLVSIVILGAIAAAIGQAMFVGLRTTNGTNQRLIESHDAQMVTSLFVTDVQSASTVLYQAADPTCSTPTTPVVTFTWTDPATGPEVASYFVQNQQLIRRDCASGSVTNVVAAHLLGSTTPTMLCDSVACTAGVTPRTVSITLKAIGTDGTTYTYSLQGSRRQT